MYSYDKIGLMKIKMSEINNNKLNNQNNKLNNYNNKCIVKFTFD